eukprot:scaffold759_cov119-Isochrysis_galbana.AAC.13
MRPLPSATSPKRASGACISRQWRIRPPCGRRAGTSNEATTTSNTSKQQKVKGSTTVRRDPKGRGIVEQRNGR